MRIGNHPKAQRGDMAKRSSRLRNRPLITLQCAAFAFLILCGTLGGLYRNALAVTGRGAAAGLCSQRKIAGFAGSSSGVDQGIPERDSAGRHTTARHMNGTVGSEAVCPAILPPSWKIKDPGDFDPEGARDIPGMHSATGKIAVLHAPILIPRDLNPIAVRAPPRLAVKYCHHNGDASPYIDTGPISRPSPTCPLFPGGTHCGPIFSNLCIRAPPMPLLPC